jgi:quercetin dioxygenase-like cupin family protein
MQKTFAFLVSAWAVAACGAQAPAGGAAAASAEALAKSASDPAMAWGACPPIFPEGCQITVLQGDPALPNADVFLRVPGGYVIPPHSHTSAERMILVSGELRVTYKGQAPSTLTVGSYAYGPAKLPHDAECVSADPCTLFIAFESPVDAAPFEGTLE